jgi:hypothetical protein
LPPQVVTEEMQVAKELEGVKAEQEKIKGQLKKVKEEAGSTGGVRLLSRTARTAAGVPA